MLVPTLMPDECEIFAGQLVGTFSLRVDTIGGTIPRQNLDQWRHMTSGMTGIDEQKIQDTRIDRDLNACPRAGCQHPRRFDRNGPGQFVHSWETGSNAGGE